MNQVDTPLADEAPGHWHAIARNWHLVGPPLRPCAGDIRLYTEAVDEWVAANGAPRALILGVTPELHNLPWPPGTVSRAADRNPAMIEHVWPGLPESAFCTDWLDLDLPPGSLDMVLCDGGLHLLSHPQGQRRLVQVLARLVRNGGLVILRLFAPPPGLEDPGCVLDDLAGGRIANINHLKLRLAMAMQTNPVHGVVLQDVWQAIQDRFPDRVSTASQIGWTAEEFNSIDSYRNSPERYHFVGRECAEEMFAESGFRVVRRHVPDHEPGARCPIIVLQRTADHAIEEP